MFVTVTRSPVSEPIEDAITAAIDVARKIGRDVVFASRQGVTLVVAPGDTLETVSVRLVEHLKK
jgi:hypothetical protein